MNKAMAVNQSRNRSRVGADLEEAENGFIIRTSYEGSGKNGDTYESKTFVAPNEKNAIKIASAHIQSITSKNKSKKSKGKSSKRKAISSKR